MVKNVILIQFILFRISNKAKVKLWKPIKYKFLFICPALCIVLWQYQVYFTQFTLLAYLNFNQAHTESHKANLLQQLKSHLLIIVQTDVQTSHSETFHHNF